MTETPADPTPVLELIEAFRWSKTMFAAVRLGVFDSLHESPKTAAQLAKELNLDANALERLVDACVALKLLARDGDAYSNTPAARDYLTRSSPRRLTGYIDYSNDASWRLWANLEDAIREGTHRWKQTYGWDGPIFNHFFRTEHAKREFLMGMHGFGCISSPVVAAAFDLSSFHTLCDLGGATGHLAIAACKRHSRLHGIVYDLPDAVPLATEIVGASTVAERIRIVPGDFFTDDLPEADLYAVGRILHDWSEAKIQKLLARIHSKLPEGGALLIAEKMLDANKAGPRWANMQNLNMLTCTEGQERTAAEYESLLRAAGFRSVECRATASPLDAILARK